MHTILSEDSNNSILLSIIIPTYNAEKTIQQCIQSILDQEIERKEIIIIDGKSTDNTLNEIASLKSKKIRVYSESDKGIYDAMNKGIKKAHGKWLYFIGADDELMPNALLKVFQNNQESYDLIYGNVWRVPSNVIYDGEFSMQKLFEKNICHQAIFYKKRLFEEIGLFNISYKSRADYAFNIQVFSRGYKTKFVPVTIAKFNDGGLSSNYFDLNFWYDFKANYIKPFKPFIPKRKRYNILWNLYYHLILNRVDLKKAFKLLSIISINEKKPVNSLKALCHYFLALIK